MGTRPCSFISGNTYIGVLVQCRGNKLEEIHTLLMSSFSLHYHSTFLTSLLVFYLCVASTACLFELTVEGWVELNITGRKKRRVSNSLYPFTVQNASYGKVFTQKSIFILSTGRYTNVQLTCILVRNNAQYKL
jgi:hypothetical protein